MVPSLIDMYWTAADPWAFPPSSILLWPFWQNTQDWAENKMRHKKCFPTNHKYQSLTDQEYTYNHLFWQVFECNALNMYSLIWEESNLSHDDPLVLHIGCCHNGLEIVKSTKSIIEQGPWRKVDPQVWVFRFNLPSCSKNLNGRSSSFPSEDPSTCHIICWQGPNSSLDVADKNSSDIRYFWSYWVWQHAFYTNAFHMYSLNTNTHPRYDDWNCSPPICKQFSQIYHPPCFAMSYDAYFYWPRSYQSHFPWSECVAQVDCT